ncbi:MAG: molybdate ABC transporter substrate-binding protein [Leptolyngbya sp. PLA3]|nr:MAG: molybdate ABC transporter substrate-binding protein [Cyanobacteria bacterium CYA]MCE7969966.1 molybdate ABC transporter substrate-binding protein [Leptolyngbya sp. PL-A3]
MVRFGVLLAALLGLLACSRGPEDDLSGAGAVRIAAAASLKPVLPDVVAEYARKHPGARVTVTYGASGNFYAQLSQGAPFDVFLSADMAYPQRLAEAGLVAGDPRVYAAGRLVLWSLRSSNLNTEWPGVLEGEEVRRIAIANPRHAPYGRAAEEALRAAGVLDRVQPKLVFGESVEQAATFVRTGSAEVGLLPKSQAVAPPMLDEGVWTDIPDELYEPILHGAVVMKSAAEADAAGSFVDFLFGPEARAIFARGGLGRPSE